MYTVRLLEKSLNNALKSFPVVFIGGPRRSGKTTLAQHFCKDYNYVLLDEIDVRNFASSDPRGFLARYPPPVIIDEIQNVPELLSYIKAKIHEDNSPGRWVLTGSQQWALMKNIGETLAGRIAILHLYPFTITEIQKTAKTQPMMITTYLKDLQKAKTIRKQSPSVGEWVLKGGYPEILFGKKLARKTWFSSYVQTYIDRDVRGNIKEINLRDFERFIQLLAARTAQQLNTAALANDVGVTIPTIKSWLTLLEASGLVFFLAPYYKNFGKRIIKAPKCYFMDTGLVCYLVGLNDQEHAMRGPMGGALFETACVSQMYKRLSVLGDERSLFYFRSTDGLEIDMLIEQSGEYYPIEVKLSSTIDQGHIQNLKKWFTVSGHHKQEGFVFSTSMNLGSVSRGIKNIHFLFL